MLRYILLAVAIATCGFITVLSNPWGGADGEMIPEYSLSVIEYGVVVIVLAILGAILRLSIKKNPKPGSTPGTAVWLIMKIITSFFSTMLLMAAAFVAGVGATAVMIRQNDVTWPAILYQKIGWYLAIADVLALTGLLLWYWERRHSETESSSAIRQLFFRKKVSIN